MANDRNDERTDRQREVGRRDGSIPGKGADAGSGAQEENESRDTGSAFDAGEGGFDADSQLGGTRREPGR